MPDTYSGWLELSRHETEGRDFSVECRDAGSRVAVVAPHGGAIEPGTSEIARAIAGPDWSWYDFRGLKRERNSVLHVTSTHFDEPRCLRLLTSCETVLTVHGEGAVTDIAWLGGLDDAAGVRLRGTLEAAGFVARRHPEPALQGMHPDNLCNRGRRGAGVQLELSKGLRRTLFAGLDRAGRDRPTARLGVFAEAVRAALDGREPA
jgi:phage replication-related protein YjqB (UPF0714/DUF867 family)